MIQLVMEIYNWPCNQLCVSIINHMINHRLQQQVVRLWTIGLAIDIIQFNIIARRVVRSVVWQSPKQSQPTTAFSGRRKTLVASLCQIKLPTVIRLQNRTIWCDRGLRTLLSICLSVRPSIRQSHLFLNVPVIVSSWRRYYHWQVMSMQKVKGKGQGHRSKQNLSQFGLFWTITPVWIRRGLQNGAHSLK